MAEARKRKPAAKKPAAKKGAKGTRGAGRGNRRDVKRTGNGLSPNVEVPKGPHLTAAQQALRDTLMLQRKAQGWTVEEIAEEVGLSVSGVKRALRKRKEAQPQFIGEDPLEIVEGLVDMWLADIGDLERMAAAYAEKQPAVAVGAKRAAADARNRLTELLQATGTLPRELGTLRVIAEARVIAVHLWDAVEAFEGAIKELELKPAERKRILAAAEPVRDALEKIAGESQG